LFKAAPKLAKERVPLPPQKLCLAKRGIATKSRILTLPDAKTEGSPGTISEKPKSEKFFRIREENSARIRGSADRGRFQEDKKSRLIVKWFIKNIQPISVGV
jgi:hypothetical protein